jgi:hypothetical protein
MVTDAALLHAGGGDSGQLFGSSSSEAELMQ